MKKLIAAIVVLFSVIVPVQAGAADQKALVIIDSYFDSKVNTSNVSCITLSSAPCTDIVKATNKNLSHAINHGNAMAEIAKKQNPNLPIILLRSGTVGATYVSDMNAADFIAALRWVDANSSKVGAVSFSRYFNAPSGCMPAAQNTAQFSVGTIKGVPAADIIIRQLISSLKLKGIPVFAATGNKSGSKIDYPACITDTVSVSVGGIGSGEKIVALYAYDSNTDYLGLYSVRSFNSTVMGLIPNTTSASTVGIAAQYMTVGTVLDKIVKLNP